MLQWVPRVELFKIPSDPNTKALRKALYYGIFVSCDKKTWKNWLFATLEPIFTHNETLGFDFSSFFLMEAHGAVIVSITFTRMRRKGEEFYSIKIALSIYPAVDCRFYPNWWFVDVYLIEVSFIDIYDLYQFVSNQFLHFWVISFTLVIKRTWKNTISFLGSLLVVVAGQKIQNIK